MIIIKVEWGTRGGGTMSDTQLLFFSWKLDKWLILTPSLILEKDLCGVELQRVNCIFVGQFSIVQIIIGIDDRAASVHHYIPIPGPASSRPHHLSHPTLSLWWIFQSFKLLQVIILRTIREIPTHSPMIKTKFNLQKWIAAQDIWSENRDPMHN